MRKFSAIFALVMGIVMIIVWTVLIATERHDFQSAPFESASLLAAESLTALGLVIGGVAVLKQRNWGLAIHLASLGMMLYTSVNSVGVFAQVGVIPASIFFALLTMATVCLLLMWALQARQSSPARQGGGL